MGCGHRMASDCWTGCERVQSQSTGPANPDAVADIKDNWMFGKALPNFQLSLGYGFRIADFMESTECPGVSLRLARAFLYQVLDS